MKPKHIFAAVALLLAACGQPPAKGDNEKGAAADQHMLLPGQYDVEFVRELMVPGRPTEPAEEIDSQCFSAETLQQPEKIFVPDSDRCTQQEAKAANGNFSATMTCKMPEYSDSDVVFEVHGSYDPDGADLSGETSVDGVTLRETRTFRRRGDC